MGSRFFCITLKLFSQCWRQDWIRVMVLVGFLPGCPEDDESLLFYTPEGKVLPLYCPTIGHKINLS